MSKLTIRKFAGMYNNLELLTQSDAAITLGDLMDKKGLFNNKIDFENQNIAFHILHNDLAAAENLKNTLSAIQAVEGEFAGLEISDEFSANPEFEMKLPSINLNLTGKITRNEVLNFKIGKIKKKILRDLPRAHVSGHLENLRSNQEDYYKDRLKHLLLIESLFYGSEISITIDRNTEINAEAVFKTTIEAMNIKPAYSQDASNNHVYTFSGSNWPFAVELVRVREFR